MSTHPHPLRSFVVFAAAAFASLATQACATDLFWNPLQTEGGGYDAQACVEKALRGDADPETIRDAATSFAAACERGEAASCSALGVMYELGRGVPADSNRARELYGMACKAHNAHGCENLSALVAAESHAPVEALAALQR